MAVPTICFFYVTTIPHKQTPTLSGPYCRKKSTNSYRSFELLPSCALIPHILVGLGVSSRYFSSSLSHTGAVLYRGWDYERSRGISLQRVNFVLTFLLLHSPDHFHPRQLIPTKRFYCWKKTAETHLRWRARHHLIWPHAKKNHGIRRTKTKQIISSTPMIYFFIFKQPFLRGLSVLYLMFRSR